jgi:hypothetical protein
MIPMIKKISASNTVIWTRTMYTMDFYNRELEKGAQRADRIF